MEMQKSPRVRWLVEKVRGKRILDIGFVGAYSEPLLHSLIIESNKNSVIIGLDMDKSTIHKHKIPDSIVGDGFNLPFRESTFDGVILAEVIEHFWDSTKLISEIFRVLEPEGKLYLTTPNPYSLNKFFKHWLLVRNPGNKRNRTNFLGAQDHKLFRDPISLCNYLDNLGFDLIELTTKNFEFPIIEILINLNFFPFNRLNHYTCIIAQKRCPL